MTKAVKDLESRTFESSGQTAWKLDTMWPVRVHDHIRMEELQSVFFPPIRLATCATSTNLKPLLTGLLVTHTWQRACNAPS